MLTEILTNSGVVIDIEHHQVHAGNHFVVRHSDVIDNTDIIEVFFQAPSSSTNIHVHMDVEVSFSARLTATLYEDTTKTYIVSNNLVPINNNRNSSRISRMTGMICYTPDGSGDGTILISGEFGAAGSFFTQAIGGRFRSSNEFILKESSKYLLKLTSGADNNSVAAILSWYEVEDRRIVERQHWNSDELVTVEVELD